MKSFRNELKVGLANEDIVKKELEREWGIKLNHRSKYDVFDYDTEEKDIFIEVKSRNIKHNEYDTALIGYNKIQRGLELQELNKDCQVYFVWKYKDGIFFVKLGDFEYEVNEFTRGKRIESWANKKNVPTAFIRYNQLKPLKSTKAFLSLNL